MLAPTALDTGWTRHGPGLRRGLDELQEARTGRPHVFDEVGGAPDVLSVGTGVDVGAIGAKHHVQPLRQPALFFRQKIGVDAQLHHEFGAVGAGKLGVGQFVVVVAQRRRTRHAHQEVGIAGKGRPQQRGLIDHVRAFGHCAARGGGLLLQGRVALDRHHTASVLLQSRQVRAFVQVTIALHQRRSGVRRRRLLLPAGKAAQVQRAAVLATQKGYEVAG